jgi:hypothetical protein
MGVVKTATGGYAVGFVLMGAVALACLLVLAGLRGAGAAARSAAAPPSAPTKF